MGGTAGGGGGGELVDFGFGLVEEGAESGVVDFLGSSELRQHQPQGGEKLDGEVMRNVVEHHPQRGRFNVVQESEDDPVTQPLRIIPRLRGFQSVNGEVRREGPTDEVGDGLGETEEVEEDEEGEDNSKPNHSISLGDVRPRFEVVEEAEFGELPIQSIQLNLSLFPPTLHNRMLRSLVREVVQGRVGLTQLGLSLSLSVGSGFFGVGGGLRGGGGGRGGGSGVVGGGLDGGSVRGGRGVVADGGWAGV